MDQIGFVWQRDRAGTGPDRSSEAVLPSRREALSALRHGLESQAGPVLLTGDTGVGKTWLCRRLRDQSAGPWQWLSVDLAPSVGPGGLYRLLLRGLSVDSAATDDSVNSRCVLEDVLLDDAARGLRRVLVVDEAQNGSVEVLEELRVLSNRLGEPGAFSGLILVGQNGLARRLTFRPLASFGSRVAARVHLQSLALEEFAEYLRWLNPRVGCDAAFVEQVLRGVGGNPGLAARAVGLLAHRIKADAERRPSPSGNGERSVSGGDTALAPAPALNLPPVLPVRPPIRIGDGVVEVGWNELPGADEGVALNPNGIGDDQGADSSVELAWEDGSPGSAVDLPPSEETIHDPYTAIQAWGEWNRTGGDKPAGASPSTARDVRPENSAPPESDETGSESLSPVSASVWADGQQVFAPYGQLFSRLRATPEAT